MFNPYSRCACCDQALSSRQPILRSTGQVDDLCGGCRRIVKKAVHYHEIDVQNLETEVWRQLMGDDAMLDQTSNGRFNDSDFD